jgi:hypothetical protein
MYCEIDLESYTFAIVKLNTAFNKLENNGCCDEVKTLIKESVDEFETLHENILKDLNHNQTNFDEYLRFFEYGLLTFPRYVEDLKTIENEELKDHMNRLIRVFDNLNKLAIAFCKTEVIK